MKVKIKANCCFTCYEKRLTRILSKNAAMAGDLTTTVLWYCPTHYNTYIADFSREGINTLTTMLKHYEMAILRGIKPYLAAPIPCL